MAFELHQLSAPRQGRSGRRLRKLETEGIRCWIAPRDTAPIADSAATIVEAIDQCRVMSAHGPDITRL